jgi:hypothetical protein
MKGMSVDEYRSMFERHRASGARMISFFGDISPQRLRAGPKYMNEFSVEPANPKHRSDLFYSALRALMNEKADARR